ncbi:MAG: hypothetical protein ACRDCW_14890 [Sarcina sp.]
MDKGYESILKCLDENEKIIFTTDKNFKFGEKNLLITGEKFFCISNLGKIYIADKNRRLKAIKVNKYDYKEKGIKFNVLNKDNIIAINSREFTDNRSESFIINMKLNDFTEISKKLINNPFKYDWVKYCIKLDEGIYETAVIDLKNEYISINTSSTKINLKYSDIIDFKEKDKAIHIISNSKDAYNILIYAFNKDIKIITKTISEKMKGEIDLVQDEISCEKTAILNKSIDSTIIDIDGSFRAELDRTISNYYKNELMDKKEVGISSTEKSQLDTCIEIKNLEEASEMKNKKMDFVVNLKKNEQSSYGKLYGSLNSINYKGRQVEISIDKELKILDKELNKESISISFDDYKYTKNDTIVILKNEENMILISLEEQDLELDKYMTNYIENTEYIGYTNNFQPFELSFINQQIIFAQTANIIEKKINIDSVADINILDENLNLENLVITLKDSEHYKFSIMRGSIKRFLKDLYTVKSYEKYSVTDVKVVENTFKEMVKEELAIFYFGDIIKIKNMIDEFYKSNVKDKKSLIEKIYNTTIKMEHSFDLVSMYYFEKFNIKINMKMFETIGKLEKLESDLAKLTKGIADNIQCLSSVKQIKATNNLLDTKLTTDMNYILEGIGLSQELCVYKSIVLDTEIGDYNFDEIIKNISILVNNILNIKMTYYYKIIHVVVDELAIEKYIESEEQIYNLCEYFVQMQMKSKIDCKTRLKDVLINIKKYFVGVEIGKNEVLDILNLVSF